MRLLLVVSGILVFAAATPADPPKPAADLPPGWSTVDLKGFEARADEALKRAGRASVTVLSKMPGETGFGSLVQRVRADDYRGKRVRLAGYSKVVEVDRSAQFWLRADGPDRQVVGFDNMNHRPVEGTADWTRCEIVLDVPAVAEALAFGFFLKGTGQMWADDLSLEVVGADVPVSIKQESREESKARRDALRRQQDPDEIAALLVRHKAVTAKKAVNLGFDDAAAGPGK